MTKILLVEDDKSLREIYGVRLLAEGYDIVSAGDGEEALAMAIKERPNLIVSDVMMPKISGFDMLDILRSTTETRGIKVIMMTALSSEDQRRRGEQLGADRYLVKSQVGIEDVVRTVHEVLADGHLTPEQRTVDKREPQVHTQPVQNPSQGASIPVTGQPMSQLSPQGQGSLASQQPVVTQSGVHIPQHQPLQTSARPVYDNQSSFSTPARTIAQPEPRQNVQPESHLPRPVAPFSTDRPAGLGERVIQPPVQNPESEMKEAQFEAELNNVLGNFSTQSIEIPTSQVLHSQDPAVQQPPQFQVPQSPVQSVPRPQVQPVSPGVNSENLSRQAVPGSNFEAR